ncbi:hypothetical protein SVIOM74S_00726 [Streptomyces violarus]
MRAAGGGELHLGERVDTALQARATAQAERTTLFGGLTAEADRVRDTHAGLAARLDVAAYRMRSTPDLRTRLASDAGRVLATRLPGHDGTGSSVAYAPDGRTLAGGGHDGTVRLWDTGGEALGAPLRFGTDRVGAVAFAPGDRDLLAATGEGGVSARGACGTGSAPAPSAARW